MDSFSHPFPRFQPLDGSVKKGERGERELEISESNFFLLCAPNCNQLLPPTTTNQHPPPIGALAFLYPLKGSQNFKDHAVAELLLFSSCALWSLSSCIYPPRWHFLLGFLESCSLNMCQLLEGNVQTTLCTVCVVPSSLILLFKFQSLLWQNFSICCFSYNNCFSVLPGTNAQREQLVWRDGGLQVLPVSVVCALVCGFKNGCFLWQITRWFHDRNWRYLHYVSLPVLDIATRMALLNILGYNSLLKNTACIAVLKLWEKTLLPGSLLQFVLLFHFLLTLPCDVWSA